MKRRMRQAEQAIATHRSALFGLAWTLMHDIPLVEDAFQDLFIKLARSSATDWNRKYLTDTMRSVCLDILRRNGRRKEVGLELDIDIPAQNMPFLLKVLGNESEIAYWLQFTTERRRTVVICRYCDDMTYNEIARALHITPRTVDRHLQNGLNDLRSAAREERERERKRKREERGDSDPHAPLE